MIDYCKLTSLNILIVLILLFNNINAQDISQHKIKCKYDIVYISQRNLNSDFISFNSFEKIITQLTHKRKLGVGDLKVLRTDNGNSRTFSGKEYELKEEIFSEEVSRNDCETIIEDWFYCALGEYNGPSDFVFLLNTSESFIEHINFKSMSFDVYKDPNKLVEDINIKTKLFKRKDETKTIVIIHYQDSDMDPCLNLKNKIENYYNSLRIEFINVRAKNYVRAKLVPQYNQNYYQIKCNHIKDFKGYEVIFSSNKIPDCTFLFSINDGGTINYNEHFSLIENNQIHLYISEYILKEHIKEFYRGQMELEESYYDLLWKWRWDITIRGYGGEDCPEVFGPINTVSNFQFSCH